MSKGKKQAKAKKPAAKQRKPDPRPGKQTAKGKVAGKPVKPAKSAAKPAKPVKPAKSAPKAASKPAPKPPAKAAKPAKPTKVEPPKPKPAPAPKAAVGKPAPQAPPKDVAVETEIDAGTEGAADAGKGRGKGKPGAPLPARAIRAKVRTPDGAEELKAKIGALAASVGQIRGLKRSLNKSFYEVGQILRDIEVKRLYEVKGYGSFEAFLEREIDLGKQLSLRITRIVQTFLREAALAAGLDRASAALEALDGEPEAAPVATGPSPGTPPRGTRIPVHKQ